MGLNVYQHSPVAQEAMFIPSDVSDAEANPVGTVTFAGGDGWVANFVTDDGRFMGEATGATEEEAVRNMQITMLHRIQDLGDEAAVAAARKRISEIRHRPTGTVSLTNLSDGEFGKAVRQAMQEQIVAEATERRDATLADKALVKAADTHSLKQDMARRSAGVPMPGFTLHGLTIPPLDLSNRSVHEIADAATVMTYSALQVLSGGQPLDREATTYTTIALIHGIASEEAKYEEHPLVIAELTPEQSAKVQALVQIMHLDEATAKAKVLA